MAQIVKSVLFFDFDSLRRSLAAHGSEVGDVFASKVREWLAGIEDGSLLTPGASDQPRRKILVKRCYADPKALGKDRDVLTANGVQVVDCPAMPGYSRSAADLHMVLDTDDAINHQTGFNEFILLAAESDLTPILFRLRAHDRTSIIYAGPTTDASYKSLADGVLDERALVELLSPGKAAAGAKIALAYTNEEPPVERPKKGERPAAPAPSAEPAPVERPSAPAAMAGAPTSKEELSTLVRRLHQATRVPLFSPRTFSELFRLLAEEVAENGYRFQTTAENVAAKLIESGRKVTRRQVGFVVKGLALKGHTFAADDRPQDLANEFRDQVLYLCKAANITLTEREMSLLTAWVAGGTAAAIPAAQPAAQPAQGRAGMVERMRKSVVSRITGDGSKRTKKASPEPEPEDETETAPAPAPAAERAAPPKAQMIGPQPEPVAEAPALQPVPETDEAIEAEADMDEGADEAPAPRPAPKEERSKRGTPLAPIPDAPRMTPARKPSLVAGAKRASTARAAKSAATSKKSTAPSLSLNEAEDVENSILAAIAEAVDVLVEDRATDAVKPKAEPVKARETAAQQPAKEIAPDEDSDDIGDEIQRILASYSQDRQSGR
jgi:hypothetical protein